MRVPWQTSCHFTTRRKQNQARLSKGTVLTPVTFMELGAMHTLLRMQMRSCRTVAPQQGPATKVLQEAICSLGVLRTGRSRQNFLCNTCCTANSQFLGLGSNEMLRGVVFLNVGDLAGLAHPPSCRCCCLCPLLPLLFSVWEH